MHYLFILTNRPKGTIYFGADDDLRARVAAHKAGKVAGLNYKHKACEQLVWFEVHPDQVSAAARQADMLSWNRSDVIRRIRILNNHWRDLTDTLDEQTLADPARIFPSDSALPPPKARPVKPQL